MWIKRPDAAERAITQDEGLRAAGGEVVVVVLGGWGYGGASCAQPLSFFFPGIWSIATDWKPTGRVLVDKSDGLPSARLTRGPVKFVPWERRDPLP